MSSIRFAKVVRVLTLIALACTIAAFLLNGTGLFDPGRDEAAKIWQIAATVPTVFYVAAIWLIQRAHAELVKGTNAETALGRLLERLGVCLFLGGLAQVFGYPWFVRLALGIRFPVANFDIAAIALGCVGLLLFVLARPIREATKARSELAEIV